MQFSIVGYRKMVLQGGDGGWLLGWVDFDLGSSPGWWAATVATFILPKQDGGTFQI